MGFHVTKKVPSQRGVRLADGVRSSEGECREWAGGLARPTPQPRRCAARGGGRLSCVVPSRVRLLVTSEQLRSVFAIVLRLAATGLVVFSATGCGSGFAHPEVSIAPLAGEDLARPCRYGLLIPDPLVTQAGVLVVFDRSGAALVAEDANVQVLAASLHYAILIAEECDARSSGDLQADATKGPARALQAGLAAFAAQSAHPELGSVPLVLFGFSASAVLSATMELAIPERIQGVLLYAAGSMYTDLDDVGVTSQTAAIPTLILADAEDEKSGTSRSYRHFEKARKLGSTTWAFGVQNNTDHCCSLSTVPLLLPWMKALSAPRVWSPVNFLCGPDGTVDAQGEIDCEFTSAGTGAAVGAQETGWMPDAASAAEWLVWSTSQTTN